MELRQCLVRATRVALCAATVANVVACGGDGPTPPAPRCGDVTVPSDLVSGTSRVTITGSQPRTFSGGSGGYTANSGLTTLSVIDAFARDVDGRPTSELFVLFPTEPEAGHSYTLTPVSAAQFDDPNFIPSGPFAVYGDGYDATARDYTRWLSNATGCLRIIDVTTVGAARSAVAQIEIAGTWERGASGAGRLSALVNAPVLTLYGAGAVRDTLFAAIDTLPARAGAASDTLATNNLSVFQTLKSGETRLTVAASARRAGTSADTAELWLVLPGVPSLGQTIALGAPSLAEAKAGRAAVPFGMVRFNGPGNPPVVKQLFRSTAGSVTIRELMLVGPAAVCGWVRGDFSFDAVGTDLATGADLGQRRITGTFRSTVTVLQPADSVRDAAVTARVVPLPPATVEQCTF
jgi:hypothetical protein